MKQNFFIAVFAIVAIAASAVLFSAFTSGTQKAQLQEKWFQYDGSGSVTDASNYGQASDSNPGCEGEEQVCAIRTMEDSNGAPQIDGTLASQINQALINPEEKPEHIQLRNVE